MKRFLSALAGLVFVVTAGVSVNKAEAASGYPLKKPEYVDWSFSGPLGKWDLAQLQRGFKVYQNVCASCHSIDLIAFRNLTALGFSDAEVKAIASEYEVEDGPNADGEMFTRAAVPTDQIPGPYANDQEAAVANNGAVPPDFSLLAKARAVERGFPTFVFDIFTMYAENGPDYIYSLLMGYEEEAPDDVEVSDGTYFNPYFIAGSALAMAQPLYGDDVEYDDGTEATIDQQSKDVAAFMMWAAEPSLVERKSLGFRVIIFLIIFSVLLYLTKKRVFHDLKKA